MKTIVPMPDLAGCPTMDDVVLTMLAQNNQKRADRKRMKKKRVRLSFSCEEDLARALMRIARDCNETRGSYMRAVLRCQVVTSPEASLRPCFPPEQDLELWAWAKIEHRERCYNDIPPDPAETFIPSRDGSRLIRLDYATAA